MLMHSEYEHLLEVFQNEIEPQHISLIHMKALSFRSRTEFYKDILKKAVLVRDSSRKIVERAL